MYLVQINGYWYLREWQIDENGKKFERTIAKFGKTKPKFRLPFIYQGSADGVVDSLKDKCIDLILTDPPYGITQNRWDETYYFPGDNNLCNGFL